MSIATITEAQREALRSASCALERETQQLSQNAATPSVTHTTRFEGVANAAVAALEVAGYTSGAALGSNQVVLTSGVKFDAVVIIGTDWHFLTPTIVGGVITGFQLTES